MFAGKNDLSVQCYSCQSLPLCRRCDFSITFRQFWEFYHSGTLRKMDSDRSNTQCNRKVEIFKEMTPIDRDESWTSQALNNIQDFIYSLRHDNSKKKTTGDMNIWRRCCSTVGETRALENIPPEELHRLCKFFNDARKKDGGVYEPGTLASLQRSIQR